MTSRVRRFGAAEPGRPLRPTHAMPPQGSVAPRAASADDLPFRTRPAAIALTGLMLVVLVGSTLAASRTQATIVATPSSVLPGSTVTIDGANFARRSSVQLTWGGSPQSMPSVTANGSGRFSVSITVPRVGAGSYIIGAMTSTSSAVARKTSGSIGSTVATAQVTVLDASALGPSPTDSQPLATGASPTLPPVQPTLFAPLDPTFEPVLPTNDPTANPTGNPGPTDEPTYAPTPPPTFLPTPDPTLGPSATPTPTPRPTPTPTPRPTPTPTPRPTATPTSPPSGGIPGIPDGYGSKFLKDFSDGRLGPFHVLTFNNDHPGQLMTQYCDYVSDSAHISVHNGYLDLRATPTSGGRWDCSLVGTWTVGGLPLPVYKWQYGTSRVMARLNTGPGVWQGTWNWAADCWCGDEIDWLEQTGSSRFTANIHGSSKDGQKVSIAPLSGWHEYGTVRTPTYVAFTLDGVEVGRTSVAMSANLTLNADAKVGLEPPTSATPDSVYLQIAWWTVD
jgi:hypothetical protein